MTLQERSADRTAVADGTVRRAALLAPSSRLAPAAVGAVAVAAVGLLAVVDPNEAGHYPTCPFLALTGLYCPGCGSLRGLHDLAHLDLAGAWSMNPLMVLVLPVLVGVWVAWARRSAAGRPRRRVAPAWLVWGFLVVVVTYWVARNVPALAPWLAP
ncbi:DUF2752 domain-containing protein [Cellulomonas sp. DKR-3]|uniref:DUF2752 domain-containing protein n=1 Tax=Cellulomonas fulva TaxID=2835530 RepID=A0ABS5U1D7_9CELL|nr:DUF2752 domain-containing protein [Cellulomonas fulva]MBT0995218.1 DUF2752 domain-containing protein [Cellulomonas fulva]